MATRHKLTFEDLRPLEHSRERPSHTAPGFAASTYPTRSQLPINLVLLIISHLDDAASLASITRASRLLYYLTIPRLYEHIRLRAYSNIRYVNDRPEGYGGGSPFATGLDALVSSPHNVAQYVREMTLCGQWRETDTHEFEKGRVPDNTMMLNIVIKAAISRAGRLEKFNWSLNTKPMGTVYQGLALRTTLTHFRMQFPSSRIPRPTVLIPAIPSLKSLHIFNLDPLCYNDDISLLISEARRLEVLNLHWSRRMRNAREPSVYLQNYLGRLAEAQHKLRPKELQFFNMFARNDGSLARCFDFSRLESIAFINCMEHDDPTTVFVDNSWIFDENSQTPLVALKRMRAEKVDRTFPRMLKHFTNLEEVYIISGKIARDKAERSSTHMPNGHESMSPVSVVSTPNNIDRTPSVDPAQRVNISDIPETTTNNGHRSNTSLTSMDWTGSTMSPDVSVSPGPNGPPSLHKNVAIASDFIAVITKIRGARIRKLLLPDTWNLGSEVICHLAHHCPNIEQLGLALEICGPENLRDLLSRFPKLTALRILLPSDSEMLRTLRAHSDIHYNMLELETWREEYNNLVWLGMGGEIARLCGREKFVVNGQDKYRGLVKVASWNDVKNIEIFGLDNLDE